MHSLQSRHFNSKISLLSFVISMLSSFLILIDASWIFKKLHALEPRTGSESSTSWESSNPQSTRPWHEILPHMHVHEWYIENKIRCPKFVNLIEFWVHVKFLNRIVRPRLSNAKIIRKVKCQLLIKLISLEFERKKYPLSWHYFANSKKFKIEDNRYGIWIYNTKLDFV